MIIGTTAEVVFKNFIYSDMYWAPTECKSLFDKQSRHGFYFEDCLLKILNLGFQPDSTVC